MVSSSILLQKLKTREWLFKMNLIDVDTSIAATSQRIERLQYELKTAQQELDKLTVERCRLTGQKICVCGKGPVLYTCFSCGANIGDCCVGYCNEEEMTGACDSFHDCYQRQMVN